MDNKDKKIRNGSRELKIYKEIKILNFNPNLEKSFVSFFKEDALLSIFNKKNVSKNILQKKEINGLEQLNIE